MALEKLGIKPALGRMGKGILIPATAWWIAEPIEDSDAPDFVRRVAHFFGDTEHLRDLMFWGAMLGLFFPVFKRVFDHTPAEAHSSHGH